MYFSSLFDQTELFLLSTRISGSYFCGYDGWWSGKVCVNWTSLLYCHIHLHTIRAFIIACYWLSDRHTYLTFLLLTSNFSMPLYFVLYRAVYPSAEELQFLTFESEIFYFLLLPPIIVSNSLVHSTSSSWLTSFTSLSKHFLHPLSPLFLLDPFLSPGIILW